MLHLDDLRRFLADETGLATISTVQQDGRVLSSIANCAIIPNPLTGDECVALVSMGTAARLKHVRRGSEVTISVRRGWNWIAATGAADLVGPEDNVESVDPEALRLLLRDIYQAAGGMHDDFDAYDAEMLRSRRAAVLVTPTRIIGNLPTA
ncbi:MAG: pyridoxamine 5'-phosphate oxidase [Acidimicrobiaceae bacterium]|nr:pyridoxamine 5'-phosphate oxidase [Acidimicrobiaceae bacterium]|tara:strand:- start:8240 stop:8692 length:453 start_codon:yes stop_codon:yes gene_type:complete